VSITPGLTQRILSPPFEQVQSRLSEPVELPYTVPPPVPMPQISSIPINPEETPTEPNPWPPYVPPPVPVDAPL